MEQVCKFISTGRPDAAHVGGADRCNLMRRCFREAASVKREGAAGAAKNP
jgi:hypothetical protein